MSNRLLHGSLAGGAVLCGVAVGILTNLITDRGSTTLACGLVVAVLCWATLEVVRASMNSSEIPDVSVTQRMRRVFGRVVGAQQVTGGRTVVRQKIKDVEAGGEVLGFEATPETRRHP